MSESHYGVIQGGLPGRNPESQAKGIYILFVWNSKGYILSLYRTSEVLQFTSKLHTN